MSETGTFPAEPAVALATLWETQGVDLADVVLDDGGTLVTRGDPAPTSRVAGPTDDAVSDTVLLTDLVLGEGGVGIVRLGHQQSLSRPVAVKTLKAEDPDLDSVNALLRESWLVANLQHPNIVPIHRLTQPPTGPPLLVMQQIEGRPWRALLKDPALASQFGADPAEPLEFHIQILLKVCQTLRYAHARGIVHLDLKPDNVMVGHFDEVYVVDWGLAASMAADAAPWIPRVSDITTVSGTPAYIAPEMVAVESEHIGPHTDVYMLGAMLHELATGTTLHTGASITDTLFNAWVSEPRTYAGDVPKELAELIQWATARDVAARLPDCQTLISAIESFLSHRASTTLTHATLERYAAVRRDVAAGTTEAEATDGVLLECRLGLRQALIIWPDNRAAVDGLQRLLQDRIDAAIAARQGGLASEFLADLPQPDAARAAKVLALQQTLATQAQQTEAIRRAYDPRVHSRTRMWSGLIVGVVWLLWNCTIGWLDREGIVPVDFNTMLWANVLTAVGFGVTLFLVRNTLMTTRLNRSGLGFFAVGIFTMASLWVLAMPLELTVPQVAALAPLIYMMFSISVGIAVDARIAWAALWMLPSAMMASYQPEYVFEWSGVSGLICGLTFGLVARPRRTTKAAP
ncbi:MAG: hypothetical protein ACI9MR_002640 [Myxococcota bacterium]|jgi:hypothetical protein